MKFLLPTLSLLLLATPLFAGAQENFQPLTGLPVFDSLGTSPDGLSGFFNQLYVIAVGAAAVIAVAQIMIAGFRWSTAGGSHSTIEEARKSIQDTVLGLLLVLSPTIVFGIINPKILNLDINTKILQRDDVSEVALYTQDPLVTQVASKLTRNEFGEVQGVCQIDFSGGDHTDRAVAISYLGKGSDDVGRACCRLLDGVFDAQDPSICRIDSLIDNDRYALAAKVKLQVSGGSVSNGTAQDVEKDAIIWSAGADPTAGITVDVPFIGFTAKWRDNVVLAIHGFRTKESCEAVAKSASAIESLIHSQPLGAGLLRANETTLSGQGLAGAIPANQIKKVVSVSKDLMMGNYCEKVEYHQK